MRDLGWEGCVNVRDLGGLPTADGGTTRAGIVVRADDIAALTPDGWSALAAYGVRTAVDLRFAEERTPLPPHAVPIGVVPIPLWGRMDRGAIARINRMVTEAEDAATAIRIMYVDALAEHARHIARAVDAVARATGDGGVVVHCAIGKDRTGIVSALLLRLAAVAIEDVADDYALSHERIDALVCEWVEGAETEAQRELRRRVCSAPRKGMLGMLEALEERHGGARRYLLGAGVAADRLELIRARLAA